MNAGYQLVRPGQAEPADIGQLVRRRGADPAHGLRSYLDHRTPGHRVRALSEDCPGLTGRPDGLAAIARGRGEAAR